MKRCWDAALLGMACLTRGVAQEPLFAERDIGNDQQGISINTLLQDHQCMIWIGADNGLFRYDGFRLHPVQLPGKEDMPGQVTSLFEDRSRRIWIGMSSGEIYYDDPAGPPRLFTPDEGLPRKAITGIGQDTTGSVWFATYGEGAYVYTGARMYNLDIHDGLSGQDIYTLTATPAGDVWLATDDGISICRFENEIKVIRRLGLKDGLPDQIITSLKADGDGHIWIGTFESGLVKYDAHKKEIVRPFEYPLRAEITSLAVFDMGEIWIGAGAEGIWRYMPDIHQVERIENFSALGPLRVNTLLSDVEGNIWAATHEGKLISGFRPFETIVLDIPEIQALYCDRSDRLWIGTHDGLYRLESYPDKPSAAVPVALPYAMNITAMYEDAFQNIWLGTIDKGLFIYHPPTSRIRHIGSMIEKGGYTIMSMAATPEAIWTATLEGIVSYPVHRNIMHDPAVAFVLLHEPWQSQLYFVFQIHVDSKDRIWFATDGKGVFCKNGDEVHQLTGNDAIEIKTVYSVCEDQGGHIWMSTPDHGLVRFDGASYTVIGQKMGLGYPFVSGMMVAANGDLILAHPRGIDRMDPEQYHFMYYRQEVGIKDFEPGLNAVAADAGGNVYIGGQHMVIKNYGAQKALSIHPQTQLTRISVFDREIDFARTHRFPYNRNYLSFEYAGLWYTSPGAVKYQYKLDGYDLQWKESKDNIASYSNLSPGRYTFYVKASENNFFHDEPVAVYAFTISPPFWMQWWFVLPAGLLTGAIVYSLIRLRDQRAERQALLEKEMAESRFSALKAQINPHFLFNSFNTLITIIDEHAAHPEVPIEYVEKLSDFYRSILQYREKETISLEEEWELVRHFVYLLKKRYGENLRLHMDAPPKEGLILPLTLQILVENAVKHNVISEKHPLDLYISADPDNTCIMVSNNLQPKSRPEPSTQFGLQSIIRRYELIGGPGVAVEKDQHTFRVIVPILKMTSA